MRVSTSAKPRHTLKWFEHRVGKDIIKNNELSVLNPPIRILSLGHAKALYHAQNEKNNTYAETILKKAEKLDLKTQHKD